MVPGNSRRGQGFAQRGVAIHRRSLGSEPLPSKYPRGGQNCQSVRFGLAQTKDVAKLRYDNSQVIFISCESKIAMLAAPGNVDLFPE